ncbi:MAG TPA: sigma-70 family RNA polymerase sigma factor [Acidimicrobiia bacterium]|nr:sigma-70 family RNA polymerase sigma factor [Acidimicrobiia bacterium]
MEGQATAVATRPDLESVYRQHGPRLWRAVFAYAQDRHVADDAVAEAFAQALRRGNAIHSPEKWVWKAAFRIAAGRLEDRRRSVPLMEVPSGRNPEPAWELLTALREVPERSRACLVLHYYGGYGTAEIARMVGSSPAAVRMQLTRGRRRLQELLEGGEGGA